MSLSISEKDLFFKLLCQMSLMDILDIKMRAEQELNIEFNISTTVSEISPTISAYGAPFYSGMEEPYFDIVLIHPGTNRLATMKLIKEMLKTNPSKAKCIIDEVPQVLFRELSRTKADKIESKFLQVGAVIQKRETYI